jgi:hypothetical protein
LTLTTTATPSNTGRADDNTQVREKTWKEGYMRLSGMKRIVVGSVLAIAFGLLLANLLTTLSAPRASVLAGEATVSPFAMMVKAPLNLPVEQYDSY